MLKVVVTSELVDARIDKAVEKNPRLREFYNDLLWRMARDPLKSARKIDDSPYYITKTYFWGPGGIPASITFIFRVTHDEVIIEGSKIDWREGSGKSRR